MAFIPAVGTVPVGEEAVPSTQTITVSFSGSAANASGANGLEFSTDKLFDGKLGNASDLSGNISIVGPISGSANIAEAVSADLLEGILVDGLSANATSATATLSQTVAFSGSSPASAAALASNLEIQMGVFGASENACDLFGAAGVPVPVSGSSGISSGTRGGVTDLLFSQWRFIDPQTSEVYRFLRNPSTAPTTAGSTRRQKSIVFDQRRADGKTVMFKKNGEAIQVRITGVLDTQEQLEALETWTRKRYAVTLRDDLQRRYEVYPQSFEPRREHKADAPYYHTYTLTYTLVE